MIARIRLVARVVAHDALVDRDASVLAVVLVALPVAASVVLSVWFTEGTFGPAAFAVVALVCVAVAVGEPTRAALNRHFWVNGGRAGTRLLLVFAQACAFGWTGSVVGVVCGAALAVAGGLVGGLEYPSVDLLGIALLNGLAGTLVAGVVSASPALRHPAIDADAAGPGAGTTFRWISVVGSLVLVVAAVELTARGAQTFLDLEIGLFVTWPFAALGVAGLAARATAGARVIARRASGPAWFALQSTGRDRRRAGPIAGMVAIVVGLCVVGVVMSASFRERVTRAEAVAASGAVPQWTDGGENEPEDLGSSSVILHRTQDEWLLAGVGAAFAVPAVGTAVALSSAARRKLDQQLELQGADPSWIRSVNAWEAFAVATTGTVVGALTAGGAVWWGFHLYNDIGRFGAALLYPPVPFVLPWPVLIAMLVGLPCLGAGFAAAITRSLRPIAFSPDTDTGLRALRMD